MDGIKQGETLRVAAYCVAWRIEIVNDPNHRGFEYIRWVWALIVGIGDFAPRMSILSSLYCDHDHQFVRCSPLRCKGTTKALVLGGGRDSSDPYILTLINTLERFADTHDM